MFFVLSVALLLLQFCLALLLRCILLLEAMVVSWAVCELKVLLWGERWVSLLLLLLSRLCMRFSSAAVDL